MKDYIKLPRSFLCSPIIDNVEAFRLCSYLYANADGCGRISFSSGDAWRMFGVTPRQFRTIVNLLSATSTATIKTTNKTTSITFYEFESSECSQPTRRPTQRQTKRPTVINETSSNTLTMSARFPFVDPMFEEAFSTWLEYKEKQWHFKYKTERSLKSAYQELVRLSGCNPCTAMRIVDQSMSNGWKGLFELKENGTRKTTDTATTAKASRDRVRSLATEIVSRSENLINLYNGQGTDSDNRQD